jgi:ribosomal subunit interface protein
MAVPLQLTYHNMEPSAAVESAVQEKVDKLGQFSDQITACHVTVDAPHKHQHKGKLYSVLIELHVPDTEIVVSRNPSENHAHEDVYVAIRDAFNSARRQLKEYEQRRRGQVKTHEPPQPPEEFTED